MKREVKYDSRGWWIPFDRKSFSYSPTFAECRMIGCWRHRCWGWWKAKDNQDDLHGGGLTTSWCVVIKTSKKQWLWPRTETTGEDSAATIPVTTGFEEEEEDIKTVLREDYQNCSMLYYVTQLCAIIMHTNMSSHYGWTVLGLGFVFFCAFVLLLGVTYLHRITRYDCVMTNI